MKPEVNKTYLIDFTEGPSKHHYKGPATFTGLQVDIQGPCYSFEIPEDSCVYFPEESIVNEL